MIGNRSQEPLLIEDIAPNGTVVQRTEAVKQSGHSRRWSIVTLGTLVGIWLATVLLIGGVVAWTGHSVWITIGDWQFIASPPIPPISNGVLMPSAIKIGSLSPGSHICRSGVGSDLGKVVWGIRDCSATTLEPLSPLGHGSPVTQP